MAITISEIAELAGVSIGTVDRVIHNRGGVNYKTAEKIVKIMQETAFTPNLNAQAMQKKSKKITLVVPIHRFTITYYGLIYKGMLEGINYLSQLGYIAKLIIIEDDTEEAYCDMLEALLTKDIFAIMTIPKYQTEKAKNLFEKLLKRGTKIIALNHKLDIEGVEYLEWYPFPENVGRIMAGAINLIHHEKEKIVYVYDKIQFFGNKFKDLIMEGFLEKIEPKIQTIFINTNDEFEAYIEVKKLLISENIDGIIATEPAMVEAVLRAKENTSSNVNIYSSDVSQSVRDNLKNGKLAFAVLYNDVRFAYRCIIEAFHMVLPEIPLNPLLIDEIDSHIYLPCNKL